MLRISSNLFFVILLPVFSQPSVFINCQTQQTRPFVDLTLELSAHKSDILPLEPIPVVFKLSNRTNQIIFGHNSISFNGGAVNVTVQKSDSQNKVYMELTTLKALIKNINGKIPPGANYESREWLTLGLERYFPEPGTYKLQAALASADMTQHIQSNTVTIQVKEPLGINRRAYELIKNDTILDGIFSGSSFDQTKITLEKLTTRFPNSEYAKSAYYILGTTYFHRRQLQQALVNFRRLENDSEFFFAERVRSYLNQINQIQTSLPHKNLHF